MRKMTFKLVEKHDGEKDKLIVLKMRNKSFPASKRRSILKLIRDCVLNLEEHTLKNDSTKLELQTVMNTLHKRFRPRGLRAGLNVKKSSSLKCGLLRFHWIKI